MSYPNPDFFYGREAPDYDSRYNLAIHKAEDQYLRQRVLGMYREYRSVLDVGCGPGTLLDLVPEIRDHDYLGLDPSQQMISLAAQKHPNVDFVHGDHYCINDLRRKFNLVVSTYVLGYIEDDEAAATQMVWALRRGGRLLVTAFGSRFNRYGPFQRHEPSTDRLQRVYHDAADLKRIFRRAGLGNIRVQGMTWRTDLAPGMPQVARWHRLEAATVGRIAPSCCNHLILTGELCRNA